MRLAAADDRPPAARTESGRAVVDCRPLVEMSSAAGREWDAFVEASPQCHYRQTAKWLWLTAREGSKPYVLTIRDATGRLTAGSAILKRAVPALGRCVLLAPYGPVVRDGEDADAVVSALLEMGRRENAVFLRVTPYVPTVVMPEPAFLTDRGFRPRKERWSFLAPAVDLMWTDITAPVDTLFADLPKDTRYNIRRAYKDGVEIDATGSPTCVAESCALLRATAEHHGSYGWHDDDPDHHTGILSRFGAQARLIVVRHEGQPLACGMFLALGQTCWHLYGGTARATRVQTARVLHWEAMQWAKTRGCVRYDMLGGVIFPAAPGRADYGLYLFKKSLNAVPVPLVGFYDAVRMPALYSALMVAERTVLPRLGGLIPRLARLSAPRGWRRAAPALSDAERVAE